MKKLLLSILLTLLPFLASADDSGMCGENVSYNYVSETGILTISGTGEMADYNYVGLWGTYCDSIRTIIIEEGVTSIGSCSFFSCDSVKTATLPNTLTTINQESFCMCVSLTDINIPNSVKSINSRAFSGCMNLTSIFIPKSVTSIESQILNGCSALTSIIVEDGNPKYDSRDNCNAIIETSSNTLIIGCNTTSIPHSVINIGYYAFSLCNFTSFIIPDGVENIMDSAFRGCSELSSLTISNSVRTIDDNAFYQCLSLTNLNIPDGVVSIGKNAFSQSNLKSIYIPKSVSSISIGAFSLGGLSSIIVDKDNITYDSRSDCNAVIETSTNTLLFGCICSFIPDGVTSIGDHAFWSCSGLGSISLPKSISNIGKECFSYTNCNEFYCYAENVPTVKGDLLDRSQTATLYVPRASLSSYQNTYPWNSFASIIAIEDINIGASSNAVEINGIYYLLNDKSKEASVTYNPNGHVGDISLPGSIQFEGKEYIVTSIGDSAFFNNERLKSIKIPNSLTSIGKSAFQGCRNLVSISIPNSVLNIGDNAFSSCFSLSKVSFPNQLKRIGNNVFKGCSSFNTVEIPDGVTSIGDGAFYGCQISSLSLSGSIKEIGNQAFAQNLLTELDIPYGVAIIGDRAFESSYYLTTVNIPSSIVSIGYNVFDLYYELSSINISDLSAWCNADIKSELFTNGVHLYLNGSEIQDLVIPNDVKKVKKNNFVGCPSIVSVTIPNRVTEVADSAFYYCTNLQTVSMQCHIDSIGKYTFYKCASLESVTIPDNVELIGEGAFYECGKLKSISLPDKLISIGKNAFYSCKDIPELIIPENVTTIGASAFSGCERIETLNIPISLTTIGDGAFSGCNGLKSLHIPPALTSIGSGAFSGCNGLTSITVDYGNMVYDSRYDCNAIIETATSTLLIGCNKSTIPNSIQIIGDYAFQNCKELKTIIIPKTVKRIGISAFENCGLTDIEIPNSVTEMYRYAFSGCELTSIILPNSITSIYYGTFKNCSALTSIDIPNSVTNIESWAFHSCRELKTITIPINVTKIGECAFEYCNSLTSIVLPKKIKEIGDHAFNTISPLSDVYCLAEDVPNGSRFYLPYGNNSTLHVPASSIEKYKNTPTLNNFANIVALTEEELAIYGTKSSQPELSKKMEGIYQVQATSDRNGVAYGRSIEVTVIDNGDGTVTFDDVFGGWYDVRANNWDGYGSNYKMGATIAVADDGNMQLLNSYIPGWGNSLDTFEGSYDAEKGTISLACLYAESFKFTENWIKVCDLFMIDGIVYGIGEDNTVSVKKWNYSGDITIPKEVTYNGTVYKVTSIGRSSYTTPQGDYWYTTNDKATFSGAFRGCAAILSVTLPNSITKIGESDFENCPVLLSVNIPNGVTSIGYRAFSNCPALNSINIPNSVLSIDEQAFYNCTGLTSMSIPGSVTSIGDMAFLHCISLRDIDLPDNLTSIGRDAFNMCNSLKSIFIPQSVLKIGDWAFGECEGLESIKVDNNNLKFDSRDNCNAIIETYYNRLYLGCKNTVIPSTVTSIGQSAFAECNGLENFIIPDNVTTIDGGAFWKCENLRALTVGSNIKEIKWAFTECPQLENFYCYSESIPETTADAFFETPIGNATLHVPAASVEAYRATTPWSGFGKIVALTDNDPKPTSVDSLKADETVSPVATYSIDGRRLSQPQRGLNIIRMSDGSTKKVMIK